LLKIYFYASRARIGLDIKDMTEKLNLNDMKAAKQIYDNVS
jgi:hypothetical protein